MKLNKKLTVFVLAFLMFAAYMFFADYIFNVLIKTDEEARCVNISLPSETNNIKFAVDLVKSLKLKWKDALFIRGWVFKENVKEEERDVYLVLKSKNSTLVFEIKRDNISRPDVTAAFKMVGEIHNHGFELSIPLYRLKEDTYKIGFVIEDETGKYYSISNKVLSISDSAVSIVDVEPGSKFLSSKVSLSLQESSREISYYFDLVSVSDKHLFVSGWGFLKGLDAESLNTYILLKKTENVIVFDVSVKTRKDVTKHFIDSGLNLDSSGFSSQIPTENLDSGNYQLGLYIVKGDQTGIVYVDKYIIVVNK